MATTLGTLLLVLQAETSAFAKGLGDAKQLAFTSSGEIVSSLKRVGDQMAKLKFENLAQWQKSGEIIGGVMSGIGVAVASASIIVAKQVAEQTKEMSKLAQSYGLSITEVSQLRVASALTGVSLEQLSTGMGRLARNAAAAAEGGKKQAQAFTTLGVAVTDGNGHLRPMNDLLLDAAGRFAKLQDGTGKTALAMQLFGRSGAALIPFLDRGKEGVKDLLDLSDQLGMTWSAQDAEGALAFKERLELLDLKTTAVKENFVKGLLPALDGLSAAFVKAGAGGTSLAKSLGGEIGASAIWLAEKFDWLTSAVAKSFIFIAGPETTESWAQFRERTKIQFDAINADHAQFIKDLETPPKLLGGGEGGAGSVPTFPAAAAKATNPDAGLAGLLNSARQLYNKAEANALETQISNIQHLRQELQAFAAAHPEAIFLDLNAAIVKLNTAEHELLAQEKAAIDLAVAEGARKQIGEVLATPLPPAVASGEVQRQSQMIDLTNDLNEQNRERLRIYEQTRTPAEQYAEELQRLNILYADSNSEEYSRALQDLNDRFREQYDPTVRLRRSLADLAEAYHLGVINAEAFERATAKVNAEIELSNTVTKPRAGLGGVAQGIGAGARSAQTEWGGWAAESAHATIQAAHDMQNAISNAFTAMIMGTKSVGQAFREMGINMLGAVVQACTQMLAEWIVTHVIMAAIAKLFGIEDDPKTRAAKQIAANVSIAQSNAGVAASEAFVEYMPLGLWTAVAMAAIADSIGQAFVVQAGAARGMDVDRDQPVNVHKGEMILPPALSSGFRNIINSFRLPAATGSGHLAFAGAGGSSFSAPMTFHVNGANDPQTTAEKVASVVTARIRRLARGKGLRT